MKTKLLFTLAITACSFFAAPGQELYVNGSMNDWPETENVPDSVARGYVWQAKNANATFSRAAGRSGEAGDYAQQIMSPGSATNPTGNNRFLCPTLNLIEGTYKLSFYTKGSGIIRWTRFSTGRSSSTDASTVTSTFSNVALNNTNEWIKHEKTFDVSAAGNYNLFIMITTDDESVVLLDDLSLSRMESLWITDANAPVGSEKYHIPDFNPNSTAYTVKLWFGSDTVPALNYESSSFSAAIEIDNGGSNRFEEGAKTKQVKIKVTEEEETKEKYTVTFDRTDYVLGFFYDHNRISGGPIASYANGYFRTTESHGTYGGNYAFRPGSSSGGSFTTAPLVNGAGTLTYWSGYYSSTISGGPYEMTVETSWAKPDSSDYGTLDSWRVDSMALHTDGKAWTKREIEINRAGPIQLTFKYLSNGSTYEPINMDDIRITPYDGSATADDVPMAMPARIFAGNRSVIIAGEPAPYRILASTGQVIASGDTASGQAEIPVKPGMYIVSSGDRTVKIAVN